MPEVVGEWHGHEEQVVAATTNDCKDKHEEVPASSSGVVRGASPGMEESEKCDGEEGQLGKDKCGEVLVGGKIEPRVGVSLVHVCADVLDVLMC